MASHKTKRDLKTKTSKNPVENPVNVRPMSVSTAPPAPDSKEKKNKTKKKHLERLIPRFYRVLPSFVEDVAVPLVSYLLIRFLELWIVLFLETMALFIVVSSSINFLKNEIELFLADRHR